jgi:hypothetical protein
MLAGVTKLFGVTRLRGRAPLALVVAGALVAVTAAVSGAATGPSGVRFAEAGHWFASPREDVVYHVNGAAGSVDARARIAGLEPGSEVVEGETSGFVVGTERILEFGKSTLAVEQTLTTPAGERPVAVEAKGGPYLVYQQTGTVVRLGDTPRTIAAGQPLGEPVVTPDGTLWLHRTGLNVFCRLRPDADQVSCPANAPPGHTGALTVLDDRVVFVDTEADTLSPVTGTGLGRATELGTDLPADAKIAPAGLRGRVAALDPARHRLHLLDAGAGAPVTVELPAGTYAVPAAGRSSVVLLDQGRRRVLSFDGAGRRQGDTQVPPEEGEPRLSRGQDERVYVEGGEGRHVLVVDDRGRAGLVPPVGAGPTTGSAAPQSPQDEPSIPPTTPATSRPATTPPSRATSPPGRTAGGPDGPEETRTPPPTRKAIPASPPGMPPGVRARPSSGRLVVSWGGAAANGAAVSGYRVTWAPAAGGASRSLTRGGASRSATLSGITAGVAYRITVAAENSAGRGPAATVRATVPPPEPARTVTVSRGAEARHGDDCLPPECAFIKVTIRGFAPNTAYDIDPFSSEWGAFNPGARLSTDSRGDLTVTDRFPFNGVGQRVWVVVDGLESNRLLWTAG